jgi:hypothetical protein
MNLVPPVTFPASQRSTHTRVRIPEASAAFGWLLHACAYTPLDCPGASITSANAVSDSDEIVGYQCADRFTDGATESPSAWHGFPFTAGVCGNIDVPGIALNHPFGIDHEGVIAGENEDTNRDRHGYLVERCPPACPRWRRSEPRL